MKLIIFKLIKWLVIRGLNILYNFIDKDKDGKLNKKELNEFYKNIRKFRKKK